MSNGTRTYSRWPGSPSENSPCAMSGGASPKLAMRKSPTANPATKAIPAPADTKPRAAAPMRMTSDSVYIVS